MIFVNDEILFTESNTVEDKYKEIDSLFDSLSNNVNTVNNYIADLVREKKANVSENLSIQEEKQRLDRAKQEFQNYINDQMSDIKKREKELDDYVTTQKNQLSIAEANFQKNMDNALEELELNKKEMEIKKNKIEEEKKRFDEYKTLELQQIKRSNEILESEKKDFEQYKELENRRIELENKNLEDKYDKFKLIINQFNSNFKPILESNKE